MNSWKVILATVVIFGAGVLTGGLLVAHIERSRPHPPHHPPENAQHAETPPFNRTNNMPRPRSPESLSKQFLQQLDDELQLTPEQHDKIAKILSSGQEQMRQVMQDNRRKVRAELTEEQQKKFEEMTKRMPRRNPNTNAPPFTNFPARSDAPPQ